MQEINVRRVMFVSFCQSEATHWDRFVKEEPALAADFHKGDAVCFVSILRDMHYFVYGVREVDNGLGGTCQVLVSHKARIHGGRGSWTGRMLANYAEDLGLKLVGRKRYEEAYAEVEAEKRKVVEAARAEKRAGGPAARSERAVVPSRRRSTSSLRRGQSVRLRKRLAGRAGRR